MENQITPSVLYIVIIGLFNIYYYNVQIQHPVNMNLTSKVKISSNGELIATCSTDNSIKLWYLKTGLLKCKLNGHFKGISNITFLPNNKYLTSALDDLIEIEKTTNILRNHTFFNNCLKFDQRSRILITGSIRIWDLKRGKNMRISSTHSDPISSLDLSFADT